MRADTCRKTAVYFFLVMFALCCNGERRMSYHLNLTDAEWHTETILLKLLVLKVWSCL